MVIDFANEVLMGFCRRNECGGGERVQVEESEAVEGRKGRDGVQEEEGRREMRGRDWVGRGGGWAWLHGTIKWFLGGRNTTVLF
jgi:hypothetical protein